MNTSTRSHVRIIAGASLLAVVAAVGFAYEPKATGIVLAVVALGYVTHRLLRGSD